MDVVVVHIMAAQLLPLIVALSMIDVASSVASEQTVPLRLLDHAISMTTAQVTMHVDHLEQCRLIVLQPIHTAHKTSLTIAAVDNVQPVQKSQAALSLVMINVAMIGTAVAINVIITMDVEALDMYAGRI